MQSNTDYKIRDLVSDDFKADMGGIEASANGNEGNFIDINNITRQYFALMVDMVESPRLREFFSKETFCGNQWKVETTDYTRHFLTEGLAIYSVHKRESDHWSKLEDLVVPNEAGEQRNIAKALLEKYMLDKENYKVLIQDKLCGCGFRIPQKMEGLIADFELDPKRLWPKVEFSTVSESGEKKEIVIENYECGVKWTSSDQAEGAQPYQVYSDNINELGQTRVNLNVTDKVVSVKFTIPYICAVFDALTSISFNDQDDLILFTT